MRYEKRRRDRQHREAMALLQGVHVTVRPRAPKHDGAVPIDWHGTDN
jgi:hypothetical protein